MAASVGIKIHLGVIDIPYQKISSNKVPQAKKGKLNKPIKVATGEQSTGDVAQWLEKKYDVMQGFVDLHIKDIAQMMTDSVQGSIESLMQGGSPRSNPFGSATAKIEKMFKFQYLDKEEITQTGATGVPTQAALNGVNHRLKSRRGPARPSFIDTGLYQSSFKAWIEK
jgi:hypothetical protein